MTVLETIKRGAEFLSGKGVDSPRLQMELLLAHALQIPRLKLYLDFERVLNDTELETLRALVKRRGEREPLQHILGSTSFCGLDLAVNRNALIPRPETEILAESGWTFLAERVSAGIKPRVLDFGTGTGCVAIALANKCPEAEVYALDVSDTALDLARINAKRHGLGERIRFLFGESLDSCPAGMQFDLFISNPPYIPAPDIPSLQPEVRVYDPMLALDGGKDGMKFFRYFAEFAPAFLTCDARVMLEFGDGQSAAVRELFSISPWEVLDIKADYAGRPRIVVARVAKKSQSAH